MDGSYVLDPCSSCVVAVAHGYLSACVVCSVCHSSYSCCVLRLWRVFCGEWSEYGMFVVATSGSVDLVTHTSQERSGSVRWIASLF